MRKKKGDAKKLSVNRETLAVLDPMSLQQLAAAAALPGGRTEPGPIFGGCQESIIVCSVMHTCVSCKEEAPILVGFAQQ